MIMGESSATAAVIAIDDKVPAQRVSYAKLKAELLKGGQVLEWKPGPEDRIGGRDAAPPPKLPGIVLDDSDAKREGEWTAGSIHGSQHIGTGYIHDSNEEKGKLSLTWNVKIPEDGTYDVILHFPPNANRATNVPINIAISDHKLATAPPKVNEREKSGSASLGKFTLKRGTSITITLSNKDTDGYVVADGVQLLKVP